MRSNVFARAFRFAIQAHQYHRVERIHGCHQQRFGVPIVITLRERFQIVMSPRVLLVTALGMKKFFSHFIRERDARCSLLRERTRRAESNDGD